MNLARCANTSFGGSNMSLKGRNFIDLADYDRAELRKILDTAHDLKEKQKHGENL